MRLSMSALLLVAVCLACSVIIGKISSVINVDVAEGEISSNPQSDDDKHASRRLKYQDDHLPGNRIPGEFADNLFWFLQISDLHISVFHDISRVSDLREFCRTTIDTIKPKIVLASGDLTDAKMLDNMGSRQYIEEWQTYKSILEESRVQQKTLWLDVRGNHDNFNVPGLHSSENFYRNFSVQGTKHLRSYMIQVRHDSDVYSFVAVDACLDPGPKRPFNFIGVVGLKEYEQLKEFDHQANSESNFTIWFGHYPTSCILSPSPGMRPLIGSSGVAYLCGHLHQLGGIVPNMYTLQKSGNLELELGDWKDNRMFRLLAFDHGLFSFVDVLHGDWPVVLPTNPKHALFMVPGKESTTSMLNSSHIRVLAFSTAAIKMVRVRINNGEWGVCKNVNGSLYVFKWNATRFKKGIHHLTVEVEDELGRSKTVVQPFSLDGTRLAFSVLPRIALMVNISVVFQCMFGGMLILCIVPMCLTRFMHKLVKNKKMRRPRLGVGFLQDWLRKIWILSTVDRIFFPLTIYALYLTIGPWSIGEVIENHTGIIFAWGMVINGSYLPGSLTYAYGFIQLFTYHFPLTLYLAHTADKRFQMLYVFDNCSMLGYLYRHLPFIFIVAVQMAYAYFFWLAYGTLAFVLGPLRTWSVILGIFLWFQAISLQEKCLSDASLVWISKSAGGRLSVAKEDQEEQKMVTSAA
ncbi:transmembrane protein 62-like [Neocloeon triangulifer]|uniref:transmembrane protein 62-like n=1 Tax=Neocloeon triangulifer TaxID=2078957 RepID=UPI00286F2F32|nr:transmembrane protein 62-like [Neocloeon triangulifer]